MMLNDEVRTALDEGQPVVALETSFLAHGLPAPVNVETALAMEAAIRAHGAVPAMIGVLGGELRVGLTQAEIEHFGSHPEIPKASERDLGVLVGLGRDGATTVAATIATADRAGIRIVATGGIGGVHRGGESSLDISADLPALARYPVAVVCSGAKSILDLPRTMEVLETEGVPIVGYRTSQLPGFHIAATDVVLEHSVNGPEEAARVLAGVFSLSGGGIILANPVPAEAAIAPERVEGWVGSAQSAARAAAIHGKAETPFLLGEIAKMSEGESLEANTSLLRNNAAVAAEIGVALAGLEARG